MSQVKHFDIIVIGSGGGTKLVRPVAALGKQVAIIEKESLGGTCLNRGCIPSKMLIHSADVATVVQEASRYDLEVKGDLEVHFQNLIKRVNEKVSEESKSIKPLYDNNPNIKLYQGEATLLGDRKVKVGAETLSADKIVIATGAEAAKVDIPGLEGLPYMTYREALKAKTLPKKMIIIGAGYIACELGYFFGALGTEVHFFVRSEMLRKEDKDIKNEFRKAFEKKFAIHDYSELKKIDYKGGIFTLDFLSKHSEKQRLQTDSCLLATGIAPNTKNLGLENTKAQLNSKGYIVVDDSMQTHEKNVYAIGDCVGHYLFRHSVNFEGEYLFNNLFGKGSPKPIKYPPMPHAVFTNPQVASVGPTEDELIKTKQPFYKGLCRYENSAMGMALRSEFGFVKLIFCQTTNLLLAAHIIGDEASNMIHMLIAYIKMNAKLDDLLETIYIHPALPETIRNAARDAKQNKI